MIPQYLIKKARAKDCGIIREFERTYFPDSDRITRGQWWIAWHKNDPVAFLGAQPNGTGVYFARVAVRKEHRGNGLQRRMQKIMQAWARAKGYACIYTDTTDNPVSANNIAYAGYKIYRPKKPWFRENTIYWRKCLG